MNKKPTHVEALGDEHLKALGMGICGAHRTGKTTLAKLLAETNKVPFAETSLSALADELGVKIGLDMPFDQRMVFQEAALTRLENLYEDKSNNGFFLADRTPIDLAAYVLTAWHPAVSGHQWDDWVLDYIKRCDEVTNRWFLTLGVLQPSFALPKKQERQKGENLEVYREALNATIIGLIYRENVTASVNIIPRSIKSLNQRASLMAQSYSAQISEYRGILKERFANT